MTAEQSACGPQKEDPADYEQPKKREALPRDLETGAEIFGKHLSPEKQRALLIVTLTACALPMILGVRMWDRIPEIVETGLIGPGGQDDSLPRWAVALLLPGLMCLLEAVAQFMLLQYQKRMKIPPAFNRLMGRWGFPTISLLFCSGAILETSGQGLSLNFYTPCILGLVLMLLGSHMFDCTEDAKLALRFSFTVNNPPLWKEVHRFAGWLWMLAGLVVAAGAMVTSETTFFSALLALVVGLFPSSPGAPPPPGQRINERGREPWNLRKASGSTACTCRRRSYAPLKNATLRCPPRSRQAASRL